MPQNSASNTKAPVANKIGLESKLKLFATKGDGWVEATMPIVTVSEANGGGKKAYKLNGKTRYKAEHWTDKHARHKMQKGTVAYLLRSYNRDLKLPCHIHLTRYAPSRLDKHDNLPMALKWILDACCEIVTGEYRPGKADEDDRISVSYNQIFSKEYGVKILITF